MLKQIGLLILFVLPAVSEARINQSNGSLNNYTYSKPNCCKDCAVGGNIEAQQCFVRAGKTPLGEDRAYSLPSNGTRTTRAVGISE